MSASADSTSHPKTAETAVAAVPLAELVKKPAVIVREIGGRKDGPDPTRYGDWEKNGRCIDF